jgi:diacylglycerol O-acyltransferase
VDSSNAVAAINADLGTNIADPAQRFATIHASTEAGKALYTDMSSTEAQLFSMLLQIPGMLLMPLGLLSRLPPFNTVISNVPGIQKTMYWNGARLDGSYPLSIVMDGVAMNITLVTNDQNVDFGIIACRRSMPQVQRVIDYMEVALTDLEDAAGLAKPKTKPKTTSQAKAKAKPKPKPKAKAKAKAKPKAKPKVKPKAKRTTGKKSPARPKRAAAKKKAN